MSTPPPFSAAPPPTPAVVAQDAVRRLPRMALLLFCLTYILPGFIGREPWKSADMAAFGAMRELALGSASWWAPTLMGQNLEYPALLPYWLGALAIGWSPSWLPIDAAARIPFVLLLSLTMTATWYATYYLARRPEAQPVPFAFGGEARPTDYARALADGALLSLIAMLGLAQMGHETTPDGVQLAGVALLFYGIAASPYHRTAPALAACAGCLTLATSGVPAFGLALALVGALARALQKDRFAQVWAAYFALLGIASAALAVGLGLWWAQWGHLPANAGEWRKWARLLLWFTWPAGLLALIALWKWRAWWRSLHIALPAGLLAVIFCATLVTQRSDRTLLLALPSIACLAALALPTLQRGVASLVDWFTLVFFSGCSLVIWVVWIAMQTGVPAQPAANVKRLMPGFEPHFSALAFAVAMCATLAWVFLVRWRVGRHRAALWKSLVLPASGAALSWLLLTTLWMPLLDFARSYAPLARQVSSRIGQPVCVEVLGLSQGQIAAFSYHANLRLKALAQEAQCPWLIVDSGAASSVHTSTRMAQWTLRATVRRPSDDNEDVLLFQRVRSVP